MAFELGTIPRWGFADETGRWNVAGRLYFWRDVARDQPKTVYQDREGTIPHTNPIILDGIGSVGAIFFNDDEPYYITMTDSLGTLPPIWEFEDYIPALAAGEGGGGGTISSNTNYAINGQFRFFFENPITNPAASEIQIAPYWFFNKSNASGTDSIQFLPFTLGSDTPPGNPTYYCRYDCTILPTGETFKDFYIKIKDVNAFQNEEITISVEQRGISALQQFEFRYLQNFGTGGSPSASVAGAISADYLTTDWTKISSSVTLPTIAGMTLGTNKDDYLAIIIRMPLDIVTQFDFTKFQVNLGDEVVLYEYQTYDKAKIEERSVNYPIYRDLNGLVTEQNIADTTTLITINEGVCADSTGYDLFRLRDALTKDITATWVEGDSVGGLATGLTIAADTWYHNFLLFSPNGKIDSGTDTSLTAANLLASAAVQSAGYTLYRRVASFRTLTGSALIKDYHQTNDIFLFDDPDNYLASIIPDTFFSALFTLDVPPGFRVQASVNLRAGAGDIYASPPFVAALNAAVTASPLYTYTVPSADDGGTNVFIVTDDNKQIRQNRRLSGGNTNVFIVTLGWKDWRID